MIDNTPTPLGVYFVPKWYYDIVYQLWLWGIPPH